MPDKSFSVFHDDIASIIEENIKLILEKPSIHELSRTFHPDEITECGRKLIYRTTSQEYNRPYTLLEYQTYMQSKVKWISLLGCIPGIKVIDTWVKASDCNYNMASIIDCVIEISKLDDMQAVVYIKSLSDFDYNKVICSGSSRKDIVRIIMDMWLIEIPKGFIIYENRDTLQYMIYIAYPQNSVINAVKAKAKELYNIQLNGKIPSRPYKTNKSTECHICEYSDKCWA